MVHPVVDIRRWIERYPLDVYLRELDATVASDFRYFEPGDIFSPRDLALTEQFRARAGEPSPILTRRPVDLLLPALGEPPRREVSKIGGAPYWPRGDWPRDEQGKPYIFLGQVCLADSQDVLPEGVRGALPGDMLLIFYEDVDEGIWSEEDGCGVHFEWQRLGLSDQSLVSLEELPIPTAQRPWTPTYFERHRSSELEGEPRAFFWGKRKIEVSGRYLGSKIGGAPVWLQGEEEAAGLGRFFAALHSINPCEDEFPFPNVQDPPWGRFPFSQDFFMLGDVGTLYLFWDGERVRWLMQCG